MEKEVVGGGRTTPFSWSSDPFLWTLGKIELVWAAVMDTTRNARLS